MGSTIRFIVGKQGTNVDGTLQDVSAGGGANVLETGDLIAANSEIYDSFHKLLNG